MADQEQNPNPGEAPPKQVLVKKPDVAPPPAAAVPPRPVLRRPGEGVATLPVAGPAARPAGVPAAVPAASVLKKETSRIPLPGVPEAPAAGGAIADLRTVRVRPPSSVPQPGSSPLPEGPKPPSEVQVQAAKSKTSRIPLDMALGAVAEAPATGPVGPKTIRLKRPAELVSAKATSQLPLAVPISSGTTGPVVPAPAAAVQEAAQTARLPTSKLSTARLAEVEAEPAPETGTSLTRRKTIKVKRPSAAAAPAVTIQAGATAARTAGEAEGQTWIAPPGSLPVIAADRAHWTFVAAAAASIVAALVLTLVLAAQACGPNASLTEFSSWRTGPDVPWPGTIVPSGR